MQRDSEALHQRLGDLEARLRTTRLLVVLLAAACGLGAVLTWASWGTIRAERVEVTGGDGRVRLVLDASGGPSMVLYGLSGDEAIAISVPDEGKSAVRIGGETHARLTATNLLLTSSDRELVLSVDGDGLAAIQLLGDARDASVELEAGDGAAGLKMRAGSEYELLEVSSR